MTTGAALLRAILLRPDDDNAPADIYPTFAPKRDGQFFRSGNRP
jgi:hypothetical protein